MARGLSFREAEFTELEAPLTEDQIRLYDDAVQVQALACMLAALSVA